MNQVKRLGIAVAIVSSLFLVFSQTAYASIGAGMSEQAACAYYIDAGTGSIIIQVLVGVFVGGAALIGVYRTRVKNFLRNLFRRGKGDKESE